jgi:hypothetical protein
LKDTSSKDDFDVVCAMPPKISRDHFLYTSSTSVLSSESSLILKGFKTTVKSAFLNLNRPLDFKTKAVDAFTNY